MAELTVFSYRPNTSLIQLIDVRFKLACLILISLASIRACLAGLCILTFLLVFLIISSRLSLISIFKELRYFFILLVFVLIVRALSTPDPTRPPILELKIMVVTWQGLYDGALICWRLMIVVIIGLSFVSMTRPSEIKAAVQWLLIPFPFIPGKRVATMMSLIIRFIPVIFVQARETIHAQRARGIESRKNPVYRLTRLAVPLIRRTFEKADKLALAMEARCYDEHRTDPELSSSWKDWITLLAVICVCTIVSAI